MVVRRFKRSSGRRSDKFSHPICKHNISTILRSSNFNSTPSDFSDTEAMAAKVSKETKSLSVAEATEMVETAVSAVKCCCCGLMEECTHAYIARVRERYGGRWICGLCAEAVKEEREREKIVITMDEALKRHMKFCQQFKSSSPPHKTNEDFILAVKHVLFRTLDSPRKDRFTCRPLGRSHSCFSTMQGTPAHGETE